MNLQEIIKTSFFVSIWVFMFQIAAGLLFYTVKKTLRQIITAKQIKNGQTRCQDVFHCHCEKDAGHEHSHVNETNMVVW
jgi:hypothetical protein